MIPTLARGGAETQLGHLAVGLAQRGDQVTLTCMDQAHSDLGALQRAGVRVLQLGASTPAAKLRSIPRLAALARRAEVVHCALWDASLYGRMAAFMARRPVTAAEHSSDRSMQRSPSGAPRERWIALHHRLLAPITFATVACAHTQLPLLESEGVRAERIVLIPNGVPVDELRAAAVRSHVSRAKLGIPDTALLVVQVARLTPEKNQRATVDAVHRLRQELGDVHALFVGDGPDDSGPERARVLGADWAHFLGTRSDVPALLALADLAVLPSRIDAQPMAMLEAMALGVPQVVADVGDLRAVIESAGAGIAVPPGDDEAFVAACRSLLASSARRAQLREAALASSARWDVVPMVVGYSRLFDRALARDHSQGDGSPVGHDHVAAGR